MARPISPARKRLQRNVLVGLVVTATVFGVRASLDYRHFRKATRLVEQAHQAGDQGNIAKSIRLYEQGVAEYPYFVSAWLELAETYLEQKSIADCERCALAALRYTNSEKSAQAVVKRQCGSLFLRMGQPAKARELLAGSLQFDPKDLLAIRLLKLADTPARAQITSRIAPSRAHTHHGHEH